ncbi:MAG: alpha-glucosidase [Deltaproteobacteria bacterium]|nr:alpha-glucosidase [Deltaproteobacteria bacterium]
MNCSMTTCLTRCVRQHRWLAGVAMLWLLSLVQASTAHAQALTNYASHTTVGRSVVVTTATGQRLRVTPYGEAIVRIQAIEAGQFLPDDHYNMVASHDMPGTLAVTDGGSFLDLTGGGARVRLAKSPLRVQVFRTGSTTPILGDAAGAVWPAGGGVAQQFAVDPAEKFVGLGHGFLGRVGKLELTGTEVSRNYGLAEGEQAPLIVPFYLSSKGYGVFVNSSFGNRFRFNVAGSYEVLLAGSELDYFVMVGPGLPAVLAQYTSLTGRPRLPQLAMFGLALSDKSEPTVSAAAWWQAKIRGHRAAGYPIDHMVNDNRWRAGGGERCVSRFEWDPVRYPDPAGFRAWMQGQGLVSTLDFNRCIANQSAGWQPSFNLPDPGTVEFGTSAPDLTRADVRAWWWNLMWTRTLDPALAYPGDALWIDEFDQMGSAPAGQILGNGRTWGEMRNNWFLLIARALGEDGWDKALQRRPFTWVRGMTAGGQRYATLWSGDIDPTYAEMKLQIRGMLAAGLGGFPFWGHDAGGFHGEAITATQFDEIYRQWSMAFGAFTPYWKPHGTVHSRWPGDRDLDSQRTARVYGDLRYQLLPYTYSFAREASETGMPIARAMLLAYSDRPEAWQRDLQYLWGSELLVVPNAGPGYNNVDTWLPPGRWYDFWNDDRFDGDRTITTSAPPGRVLLYARAGAIIPTAPVASSTAFLRRDVLDLHVYDGANGSFTLREDDGVTEAYRGAEHRETQLSYDTGTQTLSIAAATGSYPGAPAARRYVVHFHGLATPACASVDGAPVAQLRTEQLAHVLGAGAAWTASTHGTLAVVVPAAPVDRAVTVAVRGCTADVPTRYEAEAAVTNATVGAKAVASGGSYVGALNVVGSYVELHVMAAQAGEHDVTIGYANGRASRAVRGLYVGGTRIHDLYFPTTPDWDDFTVTQPVRVQLAAGDNTLRIQTDAADDETIDLDFVDVYEALPAPIAPFYQALDATGLVVVEAEHFGVRNDVGGHSWQAITYAQGYAGEGAVVAQPNLGTTIAGTESPRLDYEVQFERTGTHYVWIRGHAYGRDGDDTVTVGLDGASPHPVSFAAAEDFAWAGGELVAIEVASPGVHTLNLWMNEDGAIVDRILLTPDRAFTPDGSGPDESGHVPGVPDPDGPGTPGAGGCGCQTTDPSALPWLALGVAAVLRRRRRCGAVG